MIYHVRLILLLVLLLGCANRPKATPDTTTKHVREAVSLLKQDLPRKALAHADTAIAIMPQQPDGHFVLGQAHYVLGNYEAARAAWHSASDLDPINWAWWQSLGDVAFQLADYSASLEYYQHSLRIHPDPISWHGAAGAYWEMNRPEDARIACLNAVALDSTYAPAYQSLALIAEHDGQMDEALRQTMQALSQSPEFVPALLTAGRLKRLAGFPREAIPFLQQALHAVPNNTEIRYNLAQAYHMIGQHDEAARILSPTDP